MENDNNDAVLMGMTEATTNYITMIYIYIHIQNNAVDDSACNGDDKC